MKSSVLVVFAHPALSKSRSGRFLAESIDDLDGVRLHDLYETYPEGDIDKAPERELLLAHRHDRGKYLTVARERIQDLESLMQAEQADDLTVDAAWDPQPMREAAEDGDPPASS